MKSADVRVQANGMFQATATPCPVEQIVLAVGEKTASQPFSQVRLQIDTRPTVLSRGSAG